MGLRMARSHQSMRGRGPQDGTLTLVHVCLWPSGQRTHTSPCTAVGLRTARSHQSMRGHGPQDGTLTPVHTRLWPSGWHAHTTPCAAMGVSLQLLLSLPLGFSPVPWCLSQISKCRAQILLLPGGPCLFPNLESVVCPAASVLW